MSKPLSKVNKLDYGFVPKDADANFDPENNKRIIQEVIEESEKLWKAKKRAYDDALGERTDALAQYVKSVSEGNTNSNVSKYFGQKYLLYLKGQDILQKIQQNLQIVKDGKVIKKAGD